MVHGIEGLNRSAAVLMAFLMSMSNCLLEDAFVYMKSLRPHLMVRLRLCLKKSKYLRVVPSWSYVMNEKLSPHF